jgi:hypothetical protein
MERAPIPSPSGFPFGTPGNVFDVRPVIASDLSVFGTSRSDVVSPGSRDCFVVALFAMTALSRELNDPAPLRGRDLTVQPKKPETLNSKFIPFAIKSCHLVNGRDT